MAGHGVLVGYAGSSANCHNWVQKNRSLETVRWLHSIITSRNGFFYEGFLQELRSLWVVLSLVFEFFQSLKINNLLFTGLLSIEGSDNWSNTKFPISFQFVQRNNHHSFSALFTEIQYIKQSEHGKWDTLMPQKFQLSQCVTGI